MSGRTRRSGEVPSRTLSRFSVSVDPLPTPVVRPEPLEVSVDSPDTPLTRSPGNVETRTRPSPFPPFPPSPRTRPSVLSGTHPVRVDPEGRDVPSSPSSHTHTHMRARMDDRAHNSVSSQDRPKKGRRFPLAPRVKDLDRVPDEVRRGRRRGHVNHT